MGVGVIQVQGKGVYLVGPACRDMCPGEAKTSKQTIYVLLPLLPSPSLLPSPLPLLREARKARHVLNWHGTFWSDTVRTGTARHFGRRTLNRNGTAHFESAHFDRAAEIPNYYYPYSCFSRYDYLF